MHDTRPQGIAGFNGGIGAQYQHPAVSLARIEYAVVGDILRRRQYDGVQAIHLWLLNARVWDLSVSIWAVFLFGGNLTDTKYFTKKTEALNFSGALGRPQYFGVTVVGSSRTAAARVLLPPPER